MTTLIPMYDSVNPGQIPADAPAVAGYIDGEYAWSVAEWNRFPTPYKLSITTKTNALADVIDVEQGDASDAQSVLWAHRRRAMGITPIVYRDAAHLSSNLAAFHQAGEPIPLYWVAHWTGAAPVVLPEGWLGIQWGDAAMVGGDYDLSILDSDLYKEIFMTSATPQDFLSATLENYSGVDASGKPVHVGDALATSFVAFSNGPGHVPGDMTVFERFDKIDAALAALTGKVEQLSPNATPIPYTATGAVTLTPSSLTPSS